MILKGGTLVAAMVGLDNRSTMDVDATLKNLPLNEDNARKIVEEITAIHIEDGMIFEIKSVTPIIPAFVLCLIQLLKRCIPR
mgnify:FL=1